MVGCSLVLFLSRARPTLQWPANKGDTHTGIAFPDRSYWMHSRSLGGERIFHFDFRRDHSTCFLRLDCGRRVQDRKAFRTNLRVKTVQSDRLLSSFYSLDFRHWTV